MTATLRILIVEDDEVCRTALIRHISRKLERESKTLQFEFVSAESLNQGLALSVETNATILDLSLPDSSMQETIESIPNFQPPVIVLTGMDDAAITAACIAQGAAAVYLKGHTDGLCRSILACLMRDVIHKELASDGAQTV